MSKTVKNAFTVDVEDYFQVAAFAPYIRRDQWGTMECRVESNLHLLLQLLADSNVSATFFALGWIAERYPALMREIVDQGHELANHGYAHLPVYEQTRAQYRQDLMRAHALLEDISGTPVIGYRAPNFSVCNERHWAHDLIVETGHKYSSSVYPIRHDHYGIPNGHRFAYHAIDGLIEIPATSIRIAGNNFPAAGGGYFRLLPYMYSRWAIDRVNSQDNAPAVFYCHPWEVDPDQPRVTAAHWKSRFRHYVNLKRMAPRINALLEDFSWDRMDRVFANEIAQETRLTPTPQEVLLQ